MRESLVKAIDIAIAYAGADVPKNPDLVVQLLESSFKKIQELEQE